MWTPCWFKIPEKPTIPGSKTKEAQHKVRCAWYKPNGDHPTKLKIRIPVVYIHANQKTQDDPVLHISGGPGFATGLDQKGIQQWLNWVDHTGWKRDVVFWDHRGTGLATPAPKCKHLTKNSIYSLGKNDSSEQEARDWFRFMRNCHEKITKLKIPLNTFSTESSVQDSLNIMALIGAKSWKIYSASYGTRVALQLMRAKPKNIDSIVLDSVYPTRIHDLEVTPYYISSAFDNLFKACENHYFCMKNFPSLKKSIQKIAKELDTNPQTYYVKLKHLPRSVKVIINGNRFIWAVHGAMYDWTLIEKLPGFILSARYKKWKNLQELIKDYTNRYLDPGFSPIAYYSTECRDRDRKVSEEEYISELAKYPFIKPHVQSLWKYDICRFWTSGRAAKHFFIPVKSTIPTLIMNGKLDPATPWQWAREVHSNLGNSYLFVIKGVGHGAVNGDSCAASTASLFFNKPDKKPVKVCQKSWQHPLFSFPKEPGNKPVDPDAKANIISTSR